MTRKGFARFIFLSPQRPCNVVELQFCQATLRFTLVCFLILLLGFSIGAQSKAHKEQDSSPSNELPPVSQRDTEIQNIKHATNELREASKKAQDMNQNMIADLTKIKSELTTTSFSSVFLSIVGIAIGVFVAVWTIKRSSKELRDQTANLKLEIQNIEEVTSKRHIQEGFSEVFRKAEGMLLKSQNFCWMLNFTAQFGQIHVYNPSVYDSPEWVSKLDMENRVNQFKLALQSKAANKAVDFKLVHLKEENFDAEFLNPIAEKPNSGIQGADSETIRNEIRSRNQQALANIQQELENAGKSREEGLIPVSRMPLQMFITDIKTKDNGTNNAGPLAKACLVFFVGTKNASSAVRGIYTEHLPLVELFKSVFEDIAKHP